MIVVVYERIGPELGIWVRLLHENCSNLPVLREDFLNLLLRRKLGVYCEGHEKSSAVQVCQVVAWLVAGYLMSLVIVRKLDFYLLAIDL